VARRERPRPRESAGREIARRAGVRLVVALATGAFASNLVLVGCNHRDRGTTPNDAGTPGLAGDGALLVSPVPTASHVSQQGESRSRAARERIVGARGEENLTASEARREQWRARAESYRAALRAIESDPSLDEAGRRAALARLLADTTTAAEHPRAEGAEPADPTRPAPSASPDHG
jgi:Proteobacterial lipase chaperone protein